MVPSLTALLLLAALSPHRVELKQMVEESFGEEYNDG